MALNTILCPVGIVKFKKRIFDQWVDRWAIIDKVGIPVANVDGEGSAIEIAILINREYSNEIKSDFKDWIYTDGKDFSDLFKIGKEYYEKQNSFGLSV